MGGSVFFRQQAKIFPQDTQTNTGMPQQNQSTDFLNHLPPTNTKFPFEWNSSPCHAPQNHPGKRSSLHCLPSRKRQAEKTSGLIEPETKLHIREYLITKDKDDFSSAMRNISTKPTKGNVPEIEHLCREELPQGEKKLDRVIVSTTSEADSTRWTVGAGTVSSPRTLLSNRPTPIFIGSIILNCSCFLGTIESSHQPLQRQQSSNELVAQTNCLQSCLRCCRYL